MKKRQAMLLSVTVPLAWGTSYMFMKLGLAGIPPMTIVALRCGIAFLAMAIIFHKKMLSADKTLFLYSAIAGALLYCIFLCLLYGVAGTSASAAGFLQSTTVVMVPMLHAIISKSLPSKNTAGGVAVVMLGVFLFQGGGLSGLNRGAICCLLSALLYAVHILVTKQFVSKVAPLSLGIWQLGFAAVYASLSAFLLEAPTLPQTETQWIAILGLAFLCSAYGFVMQTVLQQYVSPETTGFMFSLEPVFSAVFAVLFLHERMGLQSCLGAVLIFTGVLLANGIFAGND